MIAYIREHSWAISLVSAITAVVVAVFAIVESRAAARYQRAQTFLLLRQQYADVSAQLPEHYRSSTSPPVRDSKNWRKIKRYWYHSFNEWYVTTQVSPGTLDELWRDYYVDAQLSALKKQSLRSVFCDLGESEFEDGPGRKYFEVLKKLQSGVPGRRSEALCPNP